MSIRVAPDITRQLFRVSRFCAVFAAIVGAAVLAGWALDVPALQGLAPGLATMKANTAACFLLAGLSLGLAQVSPGSESTRLLARYGQVTFALVVAAIGVLSLSEDVFGWDAGIDQLLFHD